MGGIFFDDLTGIAEDGAGEGAGFTGAWSEESLDLAQGFTEVSFGADLPLATHDYYTQHQPALSSTTNQLTLLLNHTHLLGRG